MSTLPPLHNTLDLCLAHPAEGLGWVIAVTLRPSSVRPSVRPSTIHKMCISSFISQWISIPIGLLARYKYWAQNLSLCLSKFCFVNFLFIFLTFQENCIYSVISQRISIPIGLLARYKYRGQNVSLCLSEFGFVNKLFTSLFICIHFTKIVSPASFLNGFQFRLVCWLDISTGQTASVRPSVRPFTIHKKCFLSLSSQLISIPLAYAC